MHLVLSLVALLVLAGHALAIARARSYWPFDHYPMYSTPVPRMRYPLIRGDQLTMFAVVGVDDDGTTAELLGAADIYPEAFHPLDRIEVVITLVRAGAVQAIAGAPSPALHQVLADLVTLARQNRPRLTALRLVAMEWADFRAPTSAFEHPDRARVFAEAHHS
ncbi:MAG TPA: hypothetical protein VGC42_32410 [Kofleriaceae bacterium]